jgi:hypothetical protein
MAEYEFPTEIIDLPSGGKVYSKDNPLSKGTIELKYMTAKEEDILASQNLIRKGVVLDKLFESVVVQTDINIDDIFIGDKNAILLATRVLGYGKDYGIEVIDQFSGETQKVNIDLSKVQIKEVDESKLSSDNRYEFTLPHSKKKVVFKLLTHKDEKEINNEIQALQRLQKGKEGASHEVTTRLRFMIVSVDGNDERGFINKWITNGFLARDSRALRNYVKEISPDMDLTYTFVSDLTGESEEQDIPFGINFFYPSD